MANNCDYEMRVKGLKEHVEEFISMMEYTHPKGYYFSRIFSAFVSKEDADKEGWIIATISGDCAWSVHSCMFDGAMTYYHDNSDPNCREVVGESKRLKLEIEIFSEELGCAFQEHYHIKNGKVLFGACVNYDEFEWDPDNESFEDFKESCGLPESLTEDDLDENNRFYKGGFGEWCYSV